MWINLSYLSQKLFVIGILSALIFVSCTPQQEKVSLKTGRWHAELQRKDGHNVPFTFLLQSEGDQIHLDFYDKSKRFSKIF